jgi:hypothetical protein
MKERMNLIMTLKQKLLQKIEESNAVIKMPTEQEKTNTEEGELAMHEGNILQFRGQSLPVQVVPEIQVSIIEAKQRVELLQQFVKEMMKPGEDYGVIPGCPKPTLFKAGAEKLTDIFGFSKQLEVVNRVEDWEKGFFAYEVKITLISKRTGLIEAEGIGSCNSKEKKFRSQDAFSNVNTLLKMAKKRAIVDAVLSATRSSGLFTQDLEDIDIQSHQKSDFSSPNDRSFRSGNSNTNLKTSNVDSSTPITLSFPITADTNVPPPQKLATSRQLNLIFKLAEDKNISGPEASMLLNERYGLKESKKLSTQQASDFIQFLLDLQ